MADVNIYTLTKTGDDNTYHFRDDSKGKANGIASLDESGKVPSSQLPETPISQIQSDYAQTDNTQVDYIKNKPTLGTAAALDVASTGDATTAQIVKGNDSRLTDARNAADVYNWAKASTKPTYTASEVGLGNVDNTSDSTKKTNFTGSIASGNMGFVTGGDAYSALAGKLSTALKGANNGLAELDSTGRVPSSQLPSYVDDIIEVDDYAHLPITGESGKIYVTRDTDLEYRWSGTTYVQISKSLALGETPETAYWGNKGKTAYDHATETKLSTATTSGFYKVAATAQGHIASLTAVQKSDITALGIPGSDTNTHRPIQVNGTQNLGNNTTALNLKNGTNITVTADGGNVTIATNAEVNQNAFSNVKVGSTTVAADSKTDTLELVAGSNVTITPDATNDKITIAATDTNTTYTFEGGTNKFTVTPSGASAQTVTITPSIANNITGSGTSGYLTKFNGTNTITNGPQLGSDTTKYLRNDGTWVKPPNDNTTYSFTGGTNQFVVTPSSGSASTVTVTPSITNNITGSGTNAYLVKFTGANTIGNGPQLGSVTSTFLTNKGTWAAPPNDNTTYSFTGGTNQFVVTPSTGSASTVKVTPSITNNITGTGTNNYIAKFNGTNTITNGPAFGSATTSFLRNDGTWAAPPNDDTKVKQDNTTSGNWRKVVLGYQESSQGSATTSATNQVYVTPKIEVQPSTGTLNATKFTAKEINHMITGAGTAASSTGSPTTYYPAKWKFNTGLSLNNGDIVNIKIPVAGHSYGVFLSVDNGTTYKPVNVDYYAGRLTTQYPVDTPISLIYDSGGQTNSIYPVSGGTATTNITGGCWRVLNFYNTNDNTYDRNKYVGTIKAGSSAIVAGNIIVGKDGVFHHLKDGTAFDITYPILYANSAIAANATGNDNYDIRDVTITTTQSLTLTAYKPVYIKGTLNGNLFTPFSTTPLTQTIPTTWDNYQYILLGVAYSTTAFYLTELHDIYACSAGVNSRSIFQKINGNNYYAVNMQLASMDLNNVMDPGFYNAGGSNHCTNTPYDSGAATATSFALIVMHSASGNYYIQICTNSGDNPVTYRRTCVNGTWSAWTELKYTDTTYTFTGGTNKFVVTPSSGSATTVTVTPSITNNVTGSGTSAYLTKWNGTNTITNGPQFGNQTTSFLRNDGTWAAPPDTDTKVTQSNTDTTNWRKVVLGCQGSSSPGSTTIAQTQQVYVSPLIEAQSNTGTLNATKYRINQAAEFRYNSSNQCVDLVFL